MKFLPVFGTTLVLSYLVLFLFGDALFTGSIFVWPAIAALISAVLIWALLKQSDRIDALEKRIQELEAGKTVPEDK